MNNRDNNVILNSSLLKFITMLMGLAAAYFLTIQSLKVDLSHKADEQTVVNLDKKLTNIEVILKEGVVSKEQFFRFSREVENRLARIEILLEEKAGERFEKEKRP